MATHFEVHWNIEGKVVILRLMNIQGHRNKYMEEKFHREKKTIELIETLVECIEN
jgi:hypothetical protein